MGLVSVARIVAFLLLMLPGAARAAATDDVRLYYIAIDGVLSENGHEGPLAAMLKEIGLRADVNFDMQLRPINRMIRELSDEDIPAAGVPQLQPLIRERYHKPMRLSPPIIFRRDFLFVRKSRALPESADDLRGLVVVKTPINTLPPDIRDRDDIMVIETQDEIAAISLLSRGRADLWISDETSTLKVLAEQGIDNIHYNPDKPYHVWPAHIVYSATLDKLVIDRIDTAILSAARDGTAQELMPGNFVSDYDSYLSVEPEK